MAKRALAAGTASVFAEIAGADELEVVSGLVSSSGQPLSLAGADGEVKLGSAAPDTVNFVGQISNFQLYFTSGSHILQPTTSATAAGGYIRVVAGAGGTTFSDPGGAASVIGGAGGAGSGGNPGGSGGFAQCKGGDGGTDGGAGGGLGGAAYLTAGRGYGTWDGGNALVQGGYHSTASQYGKVIIGESQTRAVTIGTATVTTTFKGPLVLESTAATALLDLTDGDSASDSVANHGRLRYHEGNQQFEYSENGGAYAQAFGGAAASGWTDDGTVVRLTAASDDVAIGIAAMLSSEKLRVVGDARVQGSINLEIGATRYIMVDFQSADATAGNALEMWAGTASNSAASAGQAGGTILVNAGYGGDSLSTYASGNGARASFYGGNAGSAGGSGAGGTGGEALVSGGTGGNSSTGTKGTGGVVTVQGGIGGGAGGGPGGGVDIVGGNGTPDGTVTIGATNTNAVNIGNTSINIDLDANYLNIEAYVMFKPGATRYVWVDGPSTDATAGYGLDISAGYASDSAASAGATGGKMDVSGATGGSTVSTYDAGTGGQGVFDGGDGGSAAGSGAGGTGGSATLTGGRGGTSSTGTGGTGGGAIVEGGIGRAATGGDGPGGDVDIRGGDGGGVAADGTVNIGATKTTAVVIGEETTARAATGVFLVQDQYNYIDLNTTAAAQELTFGNTTTNPTTTFVGTGPVVLEGTGQELRLDGAGALRITERAADPTNVANNGFVYTKDDGGVTELFYEDSAGTVTQLTPAAATNPEYTGVAGESLIVGDLVAIDWDAGNTEARVYKCDADDTAQLSNAVGIATNVAAAGVAVTVQLAGESPIIPNASWSGTAPATTDAGKPVYMSQTAGYVTLDLPGGNVTVQQVGNLSDGASAARKIVINVMVQLKKAA